MKKIQLDKKQKLTLKSTGNNGKRHRYEFDKDESFKEGFKNLLLELKFKEEVVDSLFKEHDHETGERSEINIKSITDHCMFLENVPYEIDVFFCSRKIILLIRTKKSIKELTQKIIENTKWNIIT